jgi:hypothetical protein
MGPLFEHRLVQNPALAAEILWECVNACFEATDRVSGPPLPAMFLVLPLTFHQRSADALANKQQPGALYRALAEYPPLVVGLQKRMQTMADLTWEGLSLGFSAALFGLESNPAIRLFPKRRTPPVRHGTEDVQSVIGASRRVGQTIAEMPLEQLCQALGVRF